MRVVTHRFARFAGLAVLLIGMGWASLQTRAQSAPPVSAMPGAQSDGTTLLPNGWRIQPAGKHLRVGDMPLNLMQTPDSKYLIVTSNGLQRPSFSVVDLSTWTVKSTMPLDNAWLGLVLHPDGTHLYSAGANQNNVQEFNYANGTITRGRMFALPAVPNGQSFAGGLAIAPDGKTLYVTRVFAQTLSSVDWRPVLNTVTLPANPTPASPPPRRRVVIALGRLEGAGLHAAVDGVAAECMTGGHPNGAGEGRQAPVRNGTSDGSVWVFDTFSGEALERI